MGAIFNELVQVFNEPVDVRSSAITLRIVTLNTNTIIAITSLIFPDVSPSKSHTHARRQTNRQVVLKPQEPRLCSFAATSKSIVAFATSRKPVSPVNKSLGTGVGRGLRVQQIVSQSLTQLLNE